MLVTGGIAEESRVLIGCAQRRHADSRLPLAGTESEGAGADAKAQPGGSLGSGLADHATRSLPSHWRGICVTWQAAALLLAEHGTRKVRSRGLIGWLEPQAFDYKAFWGLLLGGNPGLQRWVSKFPEVPGSGGRDINQLPVAAGLAFLFPVMPPQSGLWVEICVATSEPPQLLNPAPLRRASSLIFPLFKPALPRNTPAMPPEGCPSSAHAQKTQVPKGRARERFAGVGGAPAICACAEHAGAEREGEGSASPEWAGRRRAPQCSRACAAQLPGSARLPGQRANRGRGLPT